MIIQKVEKSRLETIDKDNLTFGSGFTDHMIVCEYENGKWGEPRLMPYGKMEFSPAMMGVHYGQACFEGMKAYKDKMTMFSYSVQRKTSQELTNLLSVLLCLPFQKKFSWKD